MSRQLVAVLRRPVLLVAAATTLALVFTGCDTTTISHLPDEPKALASPTEPPDGLDAEGVTAWTLWQEQGWRDYSYRLSVLCFCDSVMKAPVKVKDNHVVTVNGKPLAPDQPVTGFGNTAQPTINVLFAVLGMALEDADEVSVEYDSETGVPTSINVDWISHAIDDEISYSATQVTPTD